MDNKIDNSLLESLNDYFTQRYNLELKILKKTWNNCKNQLKRKKGLKLALDMFQTERYALLCISNIQ